MKKSAMFSAIVMVVALSCFAAGSWFASETETTDSLLNDKGKGTYDLLAHWSQGHVVALIRHAERCDRSDHQCLEGNSGITVPGMEMSLKLGQDFKSLLNLDETDIFNSPVKRTAQTAKFIFGNSSIEKPWLVDDCNGNLLSDIFEYKENDKNMVLVTHSSCINNLEDPEGKKMIHLRENGQQTYGVTIFLAVDQKASQAHVLGFLFPDDWQAIRNRTMPDS
jgi:phosphohistidine phosphatase SixA